VNVTELHERAPAQCIWKTANRQTTPHDLEPMRFDLPGIEPDAKSRGRCRERGSQDAAACDQRHPNLMHRFSVRKLGYDSDMPAPRV
jgi:hypothetical protein